MNEKDINSKKKIDIKNNVQNNDNDILFLNKKYIKKIDLLKKKINIKKKKIVKLKNKILYFKKKNYNLVLRSKADIDNLCKRYEKNITNIYKYSLEKFSIDLLPIIDNLKSALLTSKNKYININDTFKGIELTLRNFLSVIKKFGIKLINKVNVNFDTNYHQAISIIETNDVLKDNIVIEILQDGYLLNDRLLRPAMVKVFKYKK